MAVRVAVVTGSSSGSSNARDDAMETTGRMRVYRNNHERRGHSRVPSALT